MKDTEDCRFGRVQFKTPIQLTTHARGNVQNTSWTGQEYMNIVDTYIPGSPISAMEYLTRSWSPAASNFLQIFSSSNPLLSLEDSCFLQEQEESLDHRAEDCEGQPETEEGIHRLFPFHQLDLGELAGEPANRAKRRTKSTEEEFLSRIDCLQALFAIDRPHTTAYQRILPAGVSWPNLKQIKRWFEGKPVTGLLKWNKERRKEELRLQKAKVDAALSVARLAAAIASITGTSVIGLGNPQTNGEMLPCDNRLRNVVSFAASLVASVCAEAAETAGAPREHVASTINSGFATQTPEDMVALTAAAATCLRGAATLRSRTIMDAYFQQSKELLASCTALSVLTASGHRRHRLVSIHIKCRKLLLSLTKKYLGALISRREYTILDMMGEARKSRGYYFISLQTDGGDIKLLFQNEKQTEIWMSTISNFLKKQNVERANYV